MPSVNYYEGGDYILLAAEDGAASIVWTLPTLAPDVNHLAAVGAVPFSGTDTLRIQIWRREQDAFAAQHTLDIEHMGDFVMGYQAVPEWTSADTLEIRAVDQDGRDAGLGVVTIQLEPDGPVAQLDGNLIPQPILHEPSVLSEGYSEEPLTRDFGKQLIFGLEKAAVGEKVYYDRDYRFREVPDALNGATYFLCKS